MKVIVLNSTPLIYLARAGLSAVLVDLEMRKLTPPSVKQEVVDRGKKEGRPDALILERIFEEKQIEVTEPTDRPLLLRLLKVSGLHETDAQVLTLAKENHATAIVDDEAARRTAKIYGITHAGTPYLLARAVLQGILTKERAKRALDDVIAVGWRCGPETYSRIMKLFDHL